MCVQDFGFLVQNLHVVNVLVMSYCIGDLWELSQETRLTGGTNNYLLSCHRTLQKLKC